MAPETTVASLGYSFNRSQAAMAFPSHRARDPKMHRKSDHASLPPLARRPGWDPIVQLWERTASPWWGRTLGTGNNKRRPMLEVRLGRHDPMVPGFGCLPASTTTPAQIPPTDFISSRNCRHAQSSACDTRISRPIVNSDCFAPACLRAPRAGVDPVSGGWCVVLRCRPSPPGGPDDAVRLRSTG